MTQKERFRIMRGSKEFGRYGDKQLRALLRFIDEVSVPAGAELAREGRLCNQLVVVADGELETCSQGRPGKLGPGDSFGWTAMRRRGFHDATVLAASGARLLVMSHKQFRAVAALELDNPGVSWLKRRWSGDYRPAAC